MLERRKIRCCILFTLVVMVALHLHLGFLCAQDDCALAASLRPDLSFFNSSAWVDCGPRSDLHRPGQFVLQNFSTSPLDVSYRFDPEGARDLLVFIHIQKTGGTTFGKHLINNLRVGRPCHCVADRKKCDCRNSAGLTWLVSRYSTGWRCGLHADWTEMTSCVDGMVDKVEGMHRSRRYLYVTLLRDPVTRYLSEFKHVQRGATWRATRLQCNGRQASLEQIPFCFKGESWSGVSLDDFMSCQHNLANNRQTRMLANLSEVGCYRHLSDPQQQCRMLASAKETLHKLAVFGLTEYQRETQYVFEKTLGLKFTSDFFQYNHTHSSEVTLSPSQRAEATRLNELDVELYQFAKRLFFHRLQLLKRRESQPELVGIREGPRLLQVGDNTNIQDFSVGDNANEYEEGDENEADDDEDFNSRTRDEVHMSAARGQRRVASVRGLWTMNMKKTPGLN